MFNLLPAAPLDGGQVLQAVVWWRTGGQDRALRAAGRRGQVFGRLLVAVGVLSFAGGASGGLWLVLIGGFVAIVASAERKRAVLGAALRGVRVAEAMSCPVTTGPDWLTVDRFIEEIAAQAGHSVLPLLDFEGRSSGVVQLRRCRPRSGPRCGCAMWRPRCRGARSRPPRRRWRTSWTASAPPPAPACPS
ncbi:hypothetical protein ACFXKX_17730 [Streptomyces scopuliridis]|uniref:hypothetical protein n=1 Tax=Streptomyces scopuliridis TaxID=452529 RepID=UPI0036C6268F